MHIVQICVEKEMSVFEEQCFIEQVIKIDLQIKIYREQGMKIKTHGLVIFVLEIQDFFNLSYS